MSIDTEKEYSIFVKKYFLKKEILIKPIYLKFGEDKIGQKSNRYFLDKFKALNVTADKINKIYFYKFLAYPYIEICNINFYDYVLNEAKFRLLEIVDFCINEKYRKKGIGSQIMTILEKIAIKNNISQIVGELEEDRKDEPLEDRKKFFIKNGFILERSQFSKFSGVVAKKKIGDIIQL